MDETYKRLNIMLNNAITDTAKDAVELLQQWILIKVYNPQEPTVYKRTWEFMDKPWLIKKIASKITEIYYDGNQLSLNGNKGYTHGNKEKNIDRRGIMADILNDYKVNESGSGDFGGALNIDTKGQYWEPFLNDFENKLDDIFIGNAKKYGIDIKKRR